MRQCPPSIGGQKPGWVKFRGLVEVIRVVGDEGKVCKEDGFSGKGKLPDCGGRLRVVRQGHGRHTREALHLRYGGLRAGSTKPHQLNTWRKGREGRSVMVTLAVPTVS
jgi:hypothetical protein